MTEGHGSPEGSLFALWGPRGTGKTQLAVMAAMEFPLPILPQENRLPRYVKASDIFREIRGTFKRESTATEKDVVASFITPLLLIIDEAQERGESDFENITLTHIIDKRYDAMLHTIIISNLRREELGKSLGASIVSRIHETGQDIECNWPSFREKRQGGEQ
jgi:DNA replication protein DnaC